MSSKQQIKGRETRKSKQAISTRAAVSAKPVAALARGSAPTLAVKTMLKPPVKAALKVAGKPDTRAVTKSNLKEAAKLALKEAMAPAKPERIHSHPTMCLHCHLIVEMYHERGADPVKGAWQCPRCGHKYLFSHWKIKRQARGKPEAA